MAHIARETDKDYSVYVSKLTTQSHHRDGHRDGHRGDRRGDRRLLGGGLRAARGEEGQQAGSAVRAQEAWASEAWGQGRVCSHLRGGQSGPVWGHREDEEEEPCDGDQGLCRGGPFPRHFEG